MSNKCTHSPFTFMPVSPKLLPKKILTYMILLGVVALGLARLRYVKNLQKKFNFKIVNKSGFLSFGSSRKKREWRLLGTGASVFLAYPLLLNFYSTRSSYNVRKRKPQRVTSVILLAGPCYVRCNIIVILSISRGRFHLFTSSL